MSKKILENELETEISRAKSDESVLLFMDAAHFVTGAFLAQLWCFCRMFIRTSPGRKRFNVLGAYNAMTGKLHTVCNDSYINSQSVCAMLRKLRQYHPGKAITIVLCIATTTSSKKRQLGLSF
jgi:hypothetical protein